MNEPTEHRPSFVGNIIFFVVFATLMHWCGLWEGPSPSNIRKLDLELQPKKLELHQ